MQRLLNPAGGLVFLAIYGAIIISFTAWIARRHTLDKVDFLLANRRVSIPLAAMSIASSWIWAPALFVAAQKAYEQGVAGLFWFAFPNFLALLVFAPFGLKIRKLLPLGYTLPQYMGLRHGRGVHILYVIQFAGLQICSYAVQILAGSTLIQTMTGLRFHVVALMLAAITLTYTVIGGLRSTITTDFIQMALIITITGITVPWAISRAGGLSAVAGGLGGVTGGFNLFDPWVAYSFGIPATIGLLSGPIGDQMHWQRAYAIGSDRKVIKTFTVAAVLFIIVPLSLSMLGFIAANKSVSAGWLITSNQMVAPLTVANLLPSFMALIYCLMVLAALCSTLDSVLSAASSIVSVDIDSSSNDPRDEHDPKTVSVARWGMFATTILGLLIAFIPGLQIVHLFLFYGTWRASTMIPTTLSLFSTKLNSKAVFAAILGSLIFGAPVYAAGTLLNNPHLSVIGSLAVIIIGFTTCLVWSALSPNSGGEVSESA